MFAVGDKFKYKDSCFEQDNAGVSNQYPGFYINLKKKQQTTWFEIVEIKDGTAQVKRCNLDEGMYKDAPLVPVALTDLESKFDKL